MYWALTVSRVSSNYLTCVKLVVLKLQSSQALSGGHVHHRLLLSPGGF